MLPTPLAYESSCPWMSVGGGSLWTEVCSPPWLPASKIKQTFLSPTLLLISFWAVSCWTPLWVAGECGSKKLELTSKFQGNKLLLAQWFSDVAASESPGGLITAMLSCAGLSVSRSGTRTHNWHFSQVRCNINAAGSVTTLCQPLF